MKHRPFELIAAFTKEATDLYTKPQQLAAIMFTDRRFKANDVLTCRITDGDLVTIKDGKLGNEGANTHVITTCWGCVSSNFSISVAELKTLELSQIKL